MPDHGYTDPRLSPSDRWHGNRWYWNDSKWVPAREAPEKPPSHDRSLARQTRYWSGDRRSYYNGLAWVPASDAPTPPPPWSFVDWLFEQGCTVTSALVVLFITACGLAVYHLRL